MFPAIFIACKKILKNKLMSCVVSVNFNVVYILCLFNNIILELNHLLKCIDSCK